MKYILAILTILFLVGCIQQEIQQPIQQETQPTPLEPEMSEEEEQVKGEEMQKEVGELCEGVEECDDWRKEPLKDVITKETFKISDFKGKPILLESFAVWCPTCTRQQKEIQKLHEDVGDSVISIALDTDPNEEESQVINHVKSNNFKGLYSISPIEMTKALIEEFGQRIVFAPQAPMILICEDQSFRLLRSGVKSSEDLKEEIAVGC